MGFDIQAKLVSADEFVNLRRETDWGAISLAQAQASLSASLCGICLYDTHETQTDLLESELMDSEFIRSKLIAPKLIGMARIIGDGVLNLYIQDVIIAAPYRGQGLGRKLMDAVIDMLQQNYPADCTIGLMAAKSQAPFYAQFGFLTRPASTLGAGMTAQLNQLRA